MLTSINVTISTREHAIHLTCLYSNFTHISLNTYHNIVCARACDCACCSGPRRPCGTPQTDDSAGPGEALTHVDGAWEWASLSPALGSTVSAAGAGWPGTAAYSPLIKGGMKGSREANSPTHAPLLLPSPFTRPVASLYWWASTGWVILKAFLPHSPIQVCYRGNTPRLKGGIHSLLKKKYI